MRAAFSCVTRDLDHNTADNEVPVALAMDIARVGWTTWKCTVFVRGPTDSLDMANFQTGPKQKRERGGGDGASEGDACCSSDTAVAMETSDFAIGTTVI